ncbi:MAG: HAMP domain-containing protein [Bacteroidetes bacterium]|nr:HAMP domain-containing protein [Bacteroidota bacterium]
MAFIFRSVRTRLTLWYTLLLLSTLVLFGVLAYYFTGETLEENLDLSLRAEARWMRDFIQPQASKIKPGKRSIDIILGKKARRPASQELTGEDSTAEESDEIWNQIFRHSLQNTKKTYFQFSDRRGTILHRSYSLGTDSLVVTDTIHANSILLTTVYLNGDPVRIAATRDRNFTYYVGYPIADLRELLDNLFVILLVLIPIAVALSIVGGLALAKKSLQPVDEVTTRARTITAQNLDQTIPVRSPDDEIGRLITTINDMIGRLHASFAQVRQFSADASHELRTPLTVIRGEIELALRSKKSPEEYRRVLESTLEEILRLTSIINNLLTLAKAEQGLATADFSEVELNGLVEELYEDSTILAGGKNIAVSLKVNTPITLVGDRTRLRQLFLNLIDNAIKYTPEGGTVALSMEKQNGTAVFRVEDSGIGIPPEDIAKIFDRFYRVDKARSRELGGTGLGLSIAKWIAELHRGTITVSSEPQKGSVFTVQLPIN